MTTLLLSYLAAFLLFVVGFIGIGFCIKRFLKTKIKWGMFFLGIISTIAVAAIVMVLWSVTFRSDAYYNTTFFRTMLGIVYLLLLSLVKLLIVRGVFFNRYEEEKGYSFCFGFGATPGLLLSVYLLIMIPVVGFNGLFNGPVSIAEEGYLTFADNTIITVFRPAMGHVSFSLAFLLFAVMSLSIGILLRKVTQEKTRPAVPVLWMIFSILLEAFSILPLPFFSMYRLQHWHLPIIEGILALALVLLAIFVPKPREEAIYTKQFEEE